MVVRCAGARSADGQLLITSCATVVRATATLSEQLTSETSRVASRQRTLLDRARPYLIQMYRTAIAQTELQAQLPAPGLPDAQLERLVQRGLTGREAAVLVRVARGQSNKVIAADLDVSERTIGKHLQRCYRKLGAAG